MEKLVVEPTKYTPYVMFDSETDLLIIEGQSYPENAFQFFEPLLNWLEQYLTQVKKEQTIEVRLHIAYINTSSTKCFMMFLDKLNDAYLNGQEIRISWYYHADNESELECAEEFREDLSVPFVIIPQVD